MKVLTGCNVGPNINREEFWKTSKGWLVTRISNTRSDVTKQIKNHFWSKYASVFCYFFFGKLIKFGIHKYLESNPLHSLFVLAILTGQKPLCIK